MRWPDAAGARVAGVTVPRQEGPRQEGPRQALGVRLLAALPLRLLHALGAAAGWATWLLAATYRRRFEAHAALAGVTPRHRRRAIAEAGRVVTEMPRLWLRPPGQPIADPLRWEGDALIEQALQRPGGLIFMTPHLGSFEVAAQAYAERFGQRRPMTVLYRPARKAWLRAFEDAARARPGLATAPATLAGVRQMMRALQRGHTVGLLPDQVPPWGLGVWVPFFGQAAYTMTLAARLARQTGATVLLAWCERLPRGTGYVVRVVEPAHPLPTLPGSDPRAGLEATAQAMVVEHLHDLRLLDARHGLGELVVIDEHDFRAWRVDHIRLKRDAFKQPIVADDGKHRLRRPLHDRASFRESHLRRERDHIAADGWIDELRRPDAGRRVDRVERAQQHRHTAGLRQLEQP